MHCTLVLPIKENSILLGMKKRGFGSGKWNGFGGKVGEGENLLSACARELEEECFITCKKEDLIPVAKLFFHEANTEVYVDVFLLEKWDGMPKESEEMAPKWFSFDEIPFEMMWDSDSYWFMRVLKGEKLEVELFFDQNNRVEKVGYIREAKHL